jgi:hypothetical protein
LLIDEGITSHYKKLDIGETANGAGPCDANLGLIASTGRVWYDYF